MIRINPHLCHLSLTIFVSSTILSFAEEKDLALELQKLPINAVTLRAKTKKREVEGQIAEVEEAIKIFSRSKVFVKIDS